MNIPYWLEKINYPGVFIALLIILVGFLGFGLGRLSKIEDNRAPVKIESVTAPVDNLLPQSAAGEKGQGNPAVSASDSRVVASKNGAKYHLPWCPGAQTIKEENKIWFASPTAARQAGYTPAANCKGIE